MSVYFSLILPVYNVADYLRRCIQSILDQDFQDYEMILVDDGSTDHSPEICDEYARQYEHIRVIHKENGGLASARNAGLEHARGQYIWWIDSDDWIEPGALSYLYEASKDTGADIVKFNYYRLDKEKTAMVSNAVPGLYVGAQKERLLEQAFYSAGKFFLSACMHLYRLDFLKGHPTPFVSERSVGSEDYLFILSIYPHAEKILVLKECLYVYELRQGSLTQTYKKDLPERYTLLYEELNAHYQKHGMLEAYQGRICCFYCWHLLRGTCLPSEYHVSDTHPMREGRKNVWRLLRQKKVRMALQKMERSHLPWKDQMLWAAMYWKVEPFLYWLYVLKPALKKGK